MNTNFCKHEVGNPHDMHAVAVKKVIDGKVIVVGHKPQKVFSICSIFSMIKIIGGKKIGR